MKKCVVCGVDFKIKKGSAITCSKDCSVIRRASRASVLGKKKRAGKWEHRNCLGCNVLFEGKIYNQKYCNQECKRLSRFVISPKEYAIRKCLKCLVEFKPTANKQKFCNRKCWHKSKNIKPYSKVCDLCLISFTTSYSRKKFCSELCRDDNEVIVRRNKYNNDPKEKAAVILRARFKGVMAFVKNRKHLDKWYDLLGCSIGEFIEYIEVQFEDGMTWANHGFETWHLDHIKPIASFDLTNSDQIKKCFHYLNFQPLWAKDNLSKGSKLQ